MYIKKISKTQMRAVKLLIFFLLFLIPNGYTQIMTIDNQGLKRSSLLKIEKIRKTYEPQRFIIGGLGFHSSQVSLYSMVGYVKNYGLYGKLKTNFNFNSGYDDTVWGSESDELFLNGTKRGRFSITGGGMYRMNNPLSLYVGLGYGSRWLNWISTSGDIYNVEDYSHKGLEVETGVTYKYKNIFIDAGIQTNSFEYLELNLGIGISLNKLKEIR